MNIISPLEQAALGSANQQIGQNAMANYGAQMANASALNRAALGNWNQANGQLGQWSAFDGSLTYLGAPQERILTTLRPSVPQPEARHQIDFRAFHEAMDRLENVHHRMRLVLARGNLARRALKRASY